MPFHTPIQSSVSRASVEARKKQLKRFSEKTTFLVMHFPNEYINVNSFFCNGDEPESCSTLSNGLPLFRDKHHLTVNGSVDLIERFKSKIIQK